MQVIIQPNLLALTRRETPRMPELGEPDKPAGGAEASVVPWVTKGK